MAKVSEVIEHLKKFNPDEEIFITWFDKDEFVSEFNNWTDEQIPEVSEQEWLDVVSGTEADDRIAEAIMESMRFDFKTLMDKHEEANKEYLLLQQKKIEEELLLQQEQELWKE